MKFFTDRNDIGTYLSIINEENETKQFSKSSGDGEIVLRHITRVQTLLKQSSFFLHMFSLACRKPIPFLCPKSSAICLFLELWKTVQGKWSQHKLKYIFIVLLCTLVVSTSIRKRSRVLLDQVL